MVLSTLGVPPPRLPKLIGSALSLSAQLAVYPRLVRLDFPIAPVLAPIPAGAVAQSIPLQTALLSADAQTLIGAFGEYCIVGAKFEIRVNAVTQSSGFVIVYMDEKIAAAPTAANALQSPHIEVLITQTESPSRHMISWKAADFLDLQWTSTSAPGVAAWLKVFASVVNTFTAAGTGAQVIITGSLAYCLRGYVS